MSALSDAHRRYLLVDQCIGAAIVNFLLNAGIAALIFLHQDTVSLWGQQSIAGDTIGTTFFLPLLTCLIVTAIARRQMRSGALAALGWTPASHPILGWLPSSPLRRGVTLGLLCTLVVAPPAVWALSALDITAMSYWRFVIFKATFAAVLAAVVTPVISVWAIASAPPART